MNTPRFYSLARYSSGLPEPLSAKDIKAQFILTGEQRAPKRGEYFLSGAIPEAYLALADMEQEYYILARL